MILVRKKKKKVHLHLIEHFDEPLFVWFFKNQINAGKNMTHQSSKTKLLLQIKKKKLTTT